MKTETQHQRITDSAAYRSAAEKLYELRGKKKELEATRADIHSRANGNRRRNIDDAARDLREGKGLAAVVSDAALAESMERMGREIAIVSEAVRQQEREVADLESRLSREIAESRLPEYKALVMAQLSRLIEFADAAQDLTRFMEELADHGVRASSVLVPVHIGRYGVFTDENSVLSQIVCDYMKSDILSDAELSEAGVPAEIVAKFRQRFDRAVAEDAARRREEQKPAKPVIKKWF